MVRRTDKQMGEPSRKVSLELRFTQFMCPPVENALIIGKRAPIGSNAISKALEEMSPGVFRLIKMDHPVIEAALVRISDLRKLPESELIPRLIRRAEEIMSEVETLHVAASISVTTQEEIEI